MSSNEYPKKTPRKPQRNFNETLMKYKISYYSLEALEAGAKKEIKKGHVHVFVSYFLPLKLSSFLVCVDFLARKSVFSVGGERASL